MFKSKSTENEEFLPAALEVLEHPPSPIGRILIYTITAMFAFVIAWATIGKVDVIIAGQGKIIPSGHVKTVQAFEGGVVAEIFVREGELVTAGQILIELDPTDTAASVINLEKRLHVAKLDHAVYTALLTGDPAQEFIPPTDADQNRLIEMKSQMMAVFQSHQATLEEFEAEKRRLTSQLSAIDIEIQKIEDVIPVLEERVATAGSLLARDAMRQDDRLALQQSLIEMRSTRDNFKQTRLQTEASLEGAAAQKTQIISNFEAMHRTAQRDARAVIDQIDSEITTEMRRKQYRTLTAPVDGYVDQLTTYTIGGVITAGQPVMNIVPDEGRGEVEAFILNKDVGFVEVGDLAEIKLEAFPFTRYGVLEGIVTGLSNDAISHEKFGLVYKVTADITTSPEALVEIGVRINPGMNGTIEITTDQRRIIEYFISPILRYKDEAIRER